jgi:hypothetical protein
LRVAGSASHPQIDKISKRKAQKMATQPDPNRIDPQSPPETPPPAPEPGQPGQPDEAPSLPPDIDQPGYGPDEEPILP